MKFTVTLKASPNYFIVFIFSLYLSLLLCILCMYTYILHNIHVQYTCIASYYLYTRVCHNTALYFTTIIKIMYTSLNKNSAIILTIEHISCV